MAKGYFGCSLPPGACGCPQDARKRCEHSHWIPAIAQREVVSRVAISLAPELKRLIDAYVDDGCRLGSAKHTELEGFLWDNKIGILRVLEATRS